MIISFTFHLLFVSLQVFLVHCNLQFYKWLKDTWQVLKFVYRKRQQRNKRKIVFVPAILVDVALIGSFVQITRIGSQGMSLLLSVAETKKTCFVRTGTSKILHLCCTRFQNLIFNLMLFLKKKRVAFKKKKMSCKIKLRKRLQYQ